jgi:DNA-binding NtrC family response regulator
MKHDPFPLHPPVDVTATVAVVVRNSLVRETLCAWLNSFEHEAVAYETAGQALALLPEQAGVVCVDLGQLDMDGVQFLEQLRARRPGLPVIVMLASTQLDATVELSRAGAFDFVVNPVDPRLFQRVIARALQQHAHVIPHLAALRERLEAGPRAMVGQSAAMNELRRRIDRVTTSDVSICIFGESGTGKELVARALHDGSKRQHHHFVAINCAAIPASLQESELFGHEKGAFTGAVTTHKGRFEEASGGTLFLDEVGEMNLPTQATLLRTLQERTIRRVGGRTEIGVDVRIICATHRDLFEEVKQGRFREDLYYRLVVFPLRVPPLRERLQDVPELVAHFLRVLGKDVGHEVDQVCPRTMKALLSYRWPGNVRELQNVVHHAMLSCEGRMITPRDLPEVLLRRPLTALAEPEGEPEGTAERPSYPGGVVPLSHLERAAIERALVACQNNVGQAARLLGIGRTTLYRRLALLGITPPHPRG